MCLDDAIAEIERERHTKQSGLGEWYAGMVEDAAAACARFGGSKAFEPLHDNAEGQRMRDMYRARIEAGFEAANVRGLLYWRDELSNEVARLVEFQNALTSHIPERYEASEGSQESIIEDWLRDVTAIVDAAIRWRYSTGGGGTCDDLVRAVDRYAPAEEV